MEKEEFVTYEQALKLKEFGFREKCLYWYDIDRNLKAYVYIVSEEDDYDHMVSEGMIRQCGNHTNSLCCDAPTLCQVQKWLIKKGYYIHPYWDIDKDSWAVDIENKNELIEVGEGKPMYSSYEEALSAGITECLKLLKP